MKSVFSPCLCEGFLSPVDTAQPSRQSFPVELCENLQPHRSLLSPPGSASMDILQVAAVLHTSFYIQVTSDKITSWYLSPVTPASLVWACQWTSRTPRSSSRSRERGSCRLDGGHVLTCNRKLCTQANTGSQNPLATNISLHSARPSTKYLCLCEEIPNATVQKCAPAKNVWLSHLVISSEARWNVCRQHLCVSRITFGIIVQPSWTCFHVPSQTAPLWNASHHRVWRTLLSEGSPSWLAVFPGQLSTLASPWRTWLVFVPWVFFAGFVVQGRTAHFRHDYDSFSTKILRTNFRASISSPVPSLVMNLKLTTVFFTMTRDWPLIISHRKRHAFLEVKWFPILQCVPLLNRLSLPLLLSATNLRGLAFQSFPAWDFWAPPSVQTPFPSKAKTVWGVEVRQKDRAHTTQKRYHVQLQSVEQTTNDKSEHANPSNWKWRTKSTVETNCIIDWINLGNSMHQNMLVTFIEAGLNDEVGIGTERKFALNMV